MRSLGDLVSCTRTELRDHLSKHRFHGNTEATAQFLREAADAVEPFEEPPLMDIGDCLHNDDDDNDTKKQVTVSCLQPRGKFQLTIGSQGVRFGDATTTMTGCFILRPNTLRACVVFPKPDECRKTTKPTTTAVADMVCFALSEKITFKSKSYQQLCFQLPVVNGKPKKQDDDSSRDTTTTIGGVREDHTSKWMVLFQKSLNFGTMSESTTLEMNSMAT
jgi:hypothetical protein